MSHSAQAKVFHRFKGQPRSVARFNVSDRRPGVRQSWFRFGGLRFELLSLAGHAMLGDLPRRRCPAAFGVLCNG